MACSEGTLACFKLNLHAIKVSKEHAKLFLSVPAKKKMPTALKDITFRKHVLNKTTPKQPKRRAPAAQSSGVSEKLLTDKILKKLLWNRYAVEAPQQNQPRLIGDTEDLLSRRCMDIARSYVASVPPTSDGERQTVCKSTVGQQVNPTWRREKIGRLGASMFLRIVHCVCPEGVLRDILYPRAHSLKPGDPRQYGIDNEPVAVSAYVTFMACQGRNIAVEETGLHVHKDYSYIAVSPDRIVFEGSDQGLLEVKCPRSKKGMTPAEACNSDDFCCHIVDGSVVLKETHAYYFQVQGQMAVVGAQWCDFVVWTNNGPLWQSISVERVPFDKGFWEKDILPGLQYFYRFALVPELITRCIKRLNFLHTVGRGYVPYLKYKDGFYVCDSDLDTLKVCIRKLK